MELEIALLKPEDRPAFLAELGVHEPARDRLIRSCYDALGLISFLTAGPEEVRAWTISKGNDAVEAAGKIHSDIARGFIRAETVAFDDLVAAGDMKGAKAAGKVRQEGKTYVVHDGDVILFKFNV
jgi:ribosome-binding ATPase YchF (GTP1/OBG family)